MSDARSIADSVRLLLRSSWLIALVAAAAGAAGYFLAEQSETSHQAVGSVGVNDEIGWPFYVQVRDSYVSEANQADDSGVSVIDRALTESGATTLSITASETDDIQIEMVAGASSPEAASDAVEMAGQLLIEFSRDSQRTAIETDRAAAAAQLEELTTDIEDLNAEYSAATLAEGEAEARLAEGSPDQAADVAARENAQQAQSNLDRRLDEKVNLLADIETDISNYDRDLADGVGELQLVTQAEVDITNGRNPIAIGILAAVVGAFLTALAVTTFATGDTRLRASEIRSRFPLIPVMGTNVGAPESQPFPFATDHWSHVFTSSESVSLLRTPTAADSTLIGDVGQAADAVIGTTGSTDAIRTSTGAVILATDRDDVEMLAQTFHASEALGVPVIAFVLDD